MADADLDLLQGTLDVMILKSLSWGPMHGFGIAKWIRQTTDGVLQIEDSALYPALDRLAHPGLVDRLFDPTMLYEIGVSHRRDREPSVLAAAFLDRIDRKLGQ